MDNNSNNMNSIYFILKLKAFSFFTFGWWPKVILDISILSNIYIFKSLQIDSVLKAQLRLTNKLEKL